MGPASRTADERAHRRSIRGAQAKGDRPLNMLTADATSRVGLPGEPIPC